MTVTVTVIVTGDAGAAGEIAIATVIGADATVATAAVCAIATPSVPAPSAARQGPRSETKLLSEPSLSQEHKLTTLDGGLRIATEAMPSVRSVSLGMWIGAGSRDEREPEAGLSHLLEHLLFKGTAKYGSLEIDQIFDTMGAELNAGTGKESTSVYARVIDQHLAEAFDVMADMVFRPSLDDIDSERAVILEEIAMYEDDPQEKIFDVLGEAVFGQHPLGRAIIGRAEVIAETPAAEIAAFHAGRYLPGNIVIAAAGAVDHDRLVELARERVPVTAATLQRAQSAPPGEVAGRSRFEHKDTEQFHLCLGGIGLSRHDDRRFALRVLDNIFGGTSSSRLFQEIREQRGLAYAVYSFISAYHDTGQVGLYLGTRPENLAEALAIASRELEHLQEEPATAEELVRAKENLKGRVVLGLESTGARMNRLGSEILAGAPLLSLDEVVERIEAVTLEDLAALARELYVPERLTAVGIGPDEGRFQEALAALDRAGVR